MESWTARAAASLQVAGGVVAHSGVAAAQAF